MPGMVGDWEGRRHRLPVEGGRRVGVRSRVGLGQVLGGIQTCISSGFLTLMWRPELVEAEDHRGTHGRDGVQGITRVCAQCEYCWDKECSRIGKGPGRDSDEKWGAGQGSEEGHSE